jgi:hypothetical protein
MSEEPTPRLQNVDRTRLLLRPVVIEELIGADHPARSFRISGLKPARRTAVSRARSRQGDCGIALGGAPIQHPAVEPTAAVWRDHPRRTCLTDSTTTPVACTRRSTNSRHQWGAQVHRKQFFSRPRSRPSSLVASTRSTRSSAGWRFRHESCARVMESLVRPLIEARADSPRRDRGIERSRGRWCRASRRARSRSRRAPHP